MTQKFLSVPEARARFGRICSNEQEAISTYMTFHDEEDLWVPSYHGLNLIGYKLKEETMSQSRDRVRFFIPESRINKGKMGSQTYYDVLYRAFGLGRSQIVNAVTYDETAKKNGVWIVCRPSQFARFTIFRREAGIENWFSDLQATLQPATCGDPIHRVAQKACVGVCQVRAVLRAMDMHEDGLFDTVGELDASGNPYRP